MSLLSRFCLFCVLVPCFAGSPDLHAQAVDHSPKSAGDLRKQVASARARIASSPGVADGYVTLAYALMDLGVGDEAIEEARKATVADPRSALAFDAYAWTLRHNAIGIDFGHGNQYGRAVEAYKHAIALDPNDLRIRQSLADTYRYGPDGIEYGLGAELAGAVDILRYVEAHDRSLDKPSAENLAIDLFYLGRYAEARMEAESAGPSGILDATVLSCTVLLDGLPAALARADKYALARRRDALSIGAEGLWKRGHYAEAAAMLEASERDGDPDQATDRKIQIFRSLKPFVEPDAAPDDPVSTYRRILFRMLSDTMTRSEELATLAPHSIAGVTEEQVPDRSLQILAGMRQTLMEETGMPGSVISDLLMSLIKLEAGPIAAPGVAQVYVHLSSAQWWTLLVKEDQMYQMLGPDAPSIGREVFFLVDQGKLEQAAALLDLRASVAAAKTGDPLGAGAFPHLWSPGWKRDKEAMLIAAASLAPASPGAASLLPVLRSAREQAEGARRDFLTVTLNTVEFAHGDSAGALVEAKLLVSRYPESLTAVLLAGQDYAMRKDFAGWQQMLNSEAAESLNRQDLLRQRALLQTQMGKLVEGKATYKSLLDEGRATAADRNQYAWISLFAGPVNDETIQVAEHAAEGERPGFATLHTLACVYAAADMPDKAYSTLLRAMKAGYLIAPDDATWLGFGLLYEDIGEHKAAMAAYRRVSAPPTAGTGLGSYDLAQLHLEQLGTE